MGTAGVEDIELLKQLKARYCRLFDTKRWAEWGDVLTEDCKVRFSEDDADAGITGRDRIVKVMSRVMGEDGVSVHHCQLPEIEITGASTATGVWAMMDYVETTGANPLHHKGYGHYHETYVKGVGGGWRIASLQLVRVRVDQL